MFGKIFRKVYGFFVSLDTAFWIFGGLLLLFLAGSFVLPSSLAFFSGIDDEPLFKWLRVNGAIEKVWWIWAIIAGLGLMGTSTVLCTLDFLLNRLTRQRFLLKVSPQVMHIGALFIMLGHLLTASCGFKTDISLLEGEGKTVPGGGIITLENMDLALDEFGLASNWAAEVSFEGPGRSRVTSNIRPASPAYFMGLGFYFQSVAMEDPPSAVFRVSRDLGAPWALLGGILLAAGGLGFLTARMNAENKQ